MPNFNYLKNNESDFPYIDNIDVYKFDNDFDYGRFDYTQMELQICSVPWDMGEAHVGNRTISGIGNVVYFGTKAKRDEWFAKIPNSECYRFTTKFKELHRDHVIDVPVPYDMCAKHNYLVVKYAKFANENSPVQYEGNDGLREWFWFIREVEFVAPNTTRLHLLDDAFQTWIYDVNVTGMVLERGHAPMFEISATDYLKDPIDNNTLLLTDDVNFGTANQVSHIDALVLNDSKNMYACIATTANPLGTWGTKGAGTWNVPASAYYENDGVPSIYIFAIAVSNLNTFFTNVTSSVPQFKQTVQGVFFAAGELLSLGTAFTFASVSCYPIGTSRVSLDLTELKKAHFGYPSKYSEIAKLYTDPYSHIEITDENGNVDVIKIEDTTGTIKASTALSIAYPAINIDAHLTGVGGSGSTTVTFKNVTSRTFGVSGQWYETLRTWKVPMFAVVLDSATEYDYSSHFDRAQRVVDYTTEYDNTTDASATAQANVNADASNMVANAALTTTANSATTTRSNSSADTDASNTITYNSAMNSATNLIVDMSATSTIAANDQQGAISTASGAASAAVGAISSAASLDLGGAISSVANGIIGGMTTQAQTAVANGLTAVQASYTQAGNNASTTGANTNTTNKVTNQTDTATDLTDIQNDLTSGTTANSAATMNTNAARTKATSDTIAGRTRTQAQSSITNDIAQAALRAPSVFGEFSNVDSATTKPMALFANIVTQSKSAIASAGDEMLRYGYMLDRQWQFDGNWNVGKYFTYWKLRDFWVTNLNVPDMYMDRLRFFLFGGVTVWKDPADIGNVTIYDNFDL